MLRPISEARSCRPPGFELGAALGTALGCAGVSDGADVGSAPAVESTSGDWVLWPFAGTPGSVTGGAVSLTGELSPPNRADPATMSTSTTQASNMSFEASGGPERRA